MEQLFTIVDYCVVGVGVRGCVCVCALKCVVYTQARKTFIDHFEPSFFEAESLSLSEPGAHQRSWLMSSRVLLALPL